MRDTHPDDEQLSAYLDGEASLDAHVEACASCQGRMAELRRVAMAVATPVAPPPAATREAAIARALGAPLSPPPRRRAHSRSPRWSERLRRVGFPVWVPSAAVALVLVVVAAIVIGGRDKASNNAQLSLRGAATTEAPAEANGFALTVPSTAGAAAAGGSAKSSGRSVASPAAGFPTGADAALAPRPGAPDGDLGALSGPSELRQRVESTLRARGGGQRSTAGAAEGSPSPMVASAQPASPPPTVTHPCETSARRAGAANDRLVFAANADWRGTPATVLGFAGNPTPDGQTPVSVYVTSAADCSVLFSQGYGT